jgi:hypothetical protein
VIPWWWYVKNRTDDEVEWTIQVVDLGKAATNGVCLTGLTDESPIILPPKTAHSFDKRNQDKHTDNTERKCHYSEHRSKLSIAMRTETETSTIGTDVPLATDETRIDGVPVPQHGRLWDRLDKQCNSSWIDWHNDPLYTLGPYPYSYSYWSLRGPR